MNFEERACRFICHGDSLYGVLSLPRQCGTRGILIVVGGPQYRAGSHRQFTLMARALAADGIPVMRFDYRGMGDSEGDARDFNDIDDDLRCALDHFMQATPGMRDVAIWGLCDAASAALFYAWQDARVTGLALLNPWVRTESGMAQTYLRHYYSARFFAPEFWRKVLRGRFNFAAAGKSLLKLLRTASSANAASLPDRMLDGYRRFEGRVLLILSDDDYTAKEFSDLAASSPQWRRLLAAQRTRRIALDGANHTFSTLDDRRKVTDWTRDWLRSW